ncbi:hypothetical protein QBC35DRAFT_18123 [Podospora australis]|uniref:Uncharacterized protein n=1 Tax=Podospora australis TaxID=1536484 RepID=A0AAN6WNS0_9PEZI|nr:hypothetical protein QBC35DRAFT_18123 [Podospora australis]
MELPSFRLRGVCAAACFVSKLIKSPVSRWSPLIFFTIFFVSLVSSPSSIHPPLTKLSSKQCECTALGEPSFHLGDLPWSLFPLGWNAQRFLLLSRPPRLAEEMPSHAESAQTAESLGGLVRNFCQCPPMLGGDFLRFPFLRFLLATFWFFLKVRRESRKCLALSWRNLGIACFRRHTKHRKAWSKRQKPLSFTSVINSKTIKQ